MSRLRFTPGNHAYYLTPPEGGKPERVPSVTTLLNLLGKPALVRWAARVAADAAINAWDDLARLPLSERHAAIASSADQARNRAAAKGTDIHAMAEDLLHGRPVEVPDELLPKVQAVARFIEQSGMTIHLSEAQVFSDADDDLGLTAYAGTLDLIAKHPRYGVLLIDWKSGSGPWPEMALQLAGYATADYVVVHDEDHPMGGVDAAAVAMITPEQVDLHLIDRPTLNTAAGTFGLLRMLRHQPEIAFRQVSA